MTALSLALGVALLSSPSWPAREHGSRLLARLAAADHARAEPALAGVLRSTPCPETRHRLARPLAVCREARAAAYYPRHLPLWPCVDSVPGVERFGGIAPWLERVPAGPREYETLPCWVRFRRATELLARDLIRTGWTERDVDLLMAEAWFREMDREIGGRGWQSRWYGRQREWQGGYPWELGPDNGAGVASEGP